MPLYYCRHGQTDWNIQGLVQGRVNIPLNEIGIQQAQEAREHLKDLPIDLAFCSPIGRTMQTADIILKGRNIPLQEDPRLLEFYYGIYEGKSIKDEEFLARRKAHFKRVKGAESYFDVAYRVYSFLHEIEEKYPDKNVLVIAHGGLSRVVQSYFFDMENEEFETFRIGNCEIVRYDWPHRDIPQCIEPSASK